jgi:hypothetical protein
VSVEAACAGDRSRTVKAKLVRETAALRAADGITRMLDGVPCERECRLTALGGQPSREDEARQVEAQEASQRNLGLEAVLAPELAEAPLALEPERGQPCLDLGALRDVGAEVSALLLALAD